MNENVKTDKLFDLNFTLAKELLKNTEYPWEALPKIGEFIKEFGKTLERSRFIKIGDNVWIARSASVAPSASITGPCIIDEEAEIRHCAYIRGNAVIGKNSVIGNSAEIKNAIIFDNVQVPHYNYIGDSVLGARSHFGAGSLTSNVKSDRSLVSVKAKDEEIKTGLKKFGAVVGDGTEIGCNAVLCPGTVIGKNSTVYPLVRVRGFIPENHIVKSEENIVIKK